MINCLCDICKKQNNNIRTSDEFCKERFEEYKDDMFVDYFTKKLIVKTNHICKECETAINDKILKYYDKIISKILNN